MCVDHFIVTISIFYCLEPILFLTLKRNTLTRFFREEWARYNLFYYYFCNIFVFSERDVAYNLFQALDQGAGYKRKARPHTATGHATFKPAKRHPRPVTAGIRTSMPAYRPQHNPHVDDQYLNIVAKSVGRSEQYNSPQARKSLKRFFLSLKRFFF